MRWIRRLMFGSEVEEQLKQALQRIHDLEREQKVLRSSMANIQTALLAISSTQEGVAHDMHRIQEALQEIFDGVQHELMKGSGEKWH